MSKSILVLFLSLTSFGFAHASSLYLNASGQFSSSDISGALVTPNAPFSFQLTISSNPTPVVGTVTSLGFDVPFYGFSYKLNGMPVSATPTEVRFNTLANGGLFDVIFGTGLSAADFSFQGPQAFTGTTAAPALMPSNYAAPSFTYSDPANYDVSATQAAASITNTPEPSSVLLLLCGLVALVAVSLRKSVRAL